MATQTTKITESQLRRIVGKMVAEAMQKEDLSWDPQYWTEDDVDQYRAAQKRGENPNHMVGPSGRVDAKGRPIRANNAPAPTANECGDAGCGLSNEAIAHITNLVGEAIRKGLSEVGGGAQLDEGFFDFMKGAGRSIGNKVGNAAQRAGQAIGNAAQQAGQAINKQYQDIKTAGQQASMQGDHRKNLANIQKRNNQIIAQLQKWQSEGVFTSKQANSSVAMLIKALQNTYDTVDQQQQAAYNQRFGQPQQ